MGNVLDADELGAAKCIDGTDVVTGCASALV